MGWKSSTIIVNSDKEVNEKELLEALGYTNLKEIAAEPFEVAINPEDGKVFIGRYNGNLLICTQELPMTFLVETMSEGEKVLAAYFPETEICSILLHSVVNFWGYSISKNNTKIRARGGSADQGTMINFGEPVEQEIELMSKATIADDGRKIYHLDDYPDEPFEEDQIGENLVFNMTSRYFGENLDRADDLLFETELTGYDFKKGTKKITGQEVETKPNKWLKYTIIIVVVIIWKILRGTVLKN